MLPIAICVYMLVAINVEGDVRLVNGALPSEGLLEIYYAEQWGVVCDEVFGDVDAQVVCRQLGYSSNGAKAYGGSLWGYSFAPIWLSAVQCRGNESRLVDCARSEWGDPGSCFFFQDVSVVCQTSECVLRCGLMLCVIHTDMTIEVRIVSTYIYVQKLACMAN